MIARCHNPDKSFKNKIKKKTMSFCDFSRHPLFTIFGDGKDVKSFCNFFFFHGEKVYTDDGEKGLAPHVMGDTRSSHQKKKKKRGRDSTKTFAYSPVSNDVFLKMFWLLLSVWWQRKEKKRVRKGMVCLFFIFLPPTSPILQVCSCLSRNEKRKRRDRGLISLSRCLHQEMCQPHNPKWNSLFFISVSK